MWPEAELDTSRPFTRADAREAGLDLRLLRGSAFRRIFRGVYVESSTRETPALRVRAALTLFDGSAFASHSSAARVHGVPLPALPDEHVSVRVAAHRRPRPGIRCHVCPEPDVLMVDGIQVSGIAQMFVELASVIGLVDLVVVGDNVVRRGRLTPAELIEQCVASSLPHAAAALAAARLVRDRVDSPMETRLRLLLVLAGLPEPDVNLTIRDVDGEPVRRYDLSYPQVKVIVEYDGRQHIERVEGWEADLERREAIDDDGWRILVVTARGVYHHPERTVDRVWRLLRLRRLPGVPTVASADWRPHFPGRD